MMLFVVRKEGKEVTLVSSMCFEKDLVELLHFVEVVGSQHYTCEPRWTQDFGAWTLKVRHVEVMEQ